MTEPNDFNQEVSRLKLPVPCKSCAISCWNHECALESQKFLFDGRNGDHCKPEWAGDTAFAPHNAYGRYRCWLSTRGCFLHSSQTLQICFSAGQDLCGLLIINRGIKTVGKRHSRFTQVTSCCPIWPGGPPGNEIEGNHSCCLTPPPPLLPQRSCWGGVRQS